MNAFIPAEILREAADEKSLILPWTVDQYHWAIQNGFVEESTAFELLEGLIVRKIRNAEGKDPLTIGDRHRIAVQTLVKSASGFEPHCCHLQIQQPISCPPRSEPEPDASVVRGTETDYRNGPPGPGDVLCVIEVADASLRRDRTVKLRMYARAGIPIYVIDNLIDNVVEVYRNPSGDTYGAPELLRAGDVLKLPTADGSFVEIPVEHLLA